MANEKDPAAPAPPAPPVEGATKQFSLKMSGWLNALNVDLEGASPDAALDLLGQPDAAKPAAEGAKAEEDLSLEATLFPSEPPPKP